MSHDIIVLMLLLHINYYYIILNIFNYAKSFYIINFYLRKILGICPWASDQNMRQSLSSKMGWTLANEMTWNGIGIDGKT